LLGFDFIVSLFRQGMITQAHSLFIPGRFRRPSPASSHLLIFPVPTTLLRDKFHSFFHTVCFYFISTLVGWALSSLMRCPQRAFFLFSDEVFPLFLRSPLGIRDTRPSLLTHPLHCSWEGCWRVHFPFRESTRNPGGLAKCSILFFTPLPLC